MAWYGHRRTREKRIGARAAVVGVGIAMVGFLAIQTSSAVRDGVNAARSTMDGATANVAGVVSPLASVSLGFGGDPKTANQVADLQAQIRDLERWKAAAEGMALRMKIYEQILHAMGEATGREVTARVVAETGGPFSATRLANAGSANGVIEGFAAVNERGLVGRVIRVGEHTSRILLVTDYNSHIPVMGVQSQDRALLVGDRGQGARLEQPETPDKIVEGETWVTSGDDGQLPIGLRVGRVRKVGAEWRVDLAMMEAPVSYVRLLPPPDFDKPEAAPAKAPADGAGDPTAPADAGAAAAKPAGAKPAAAKPASSKPVASKPAQSKPGATAAATTPTTTTVPSAATPAAPGAKPALVKPAATTKPAKPSETTR